MSQKKTKINKTAFGLAKTFAQQLLPKETEQEIDEAEQKKLRALEEEVMWERNQTYKSDVVERNLTQMIDVLHQRLNQLSHVVEERNLLCAEDGNGASTVESKQHSVAATDDFDDINPRLLRDPRAHMHKDSNLISDAKNEGVFIDPLRLVLKTKAMTDNAKKLENRLEESFGMVNLREGKGKGKNKGAASSKTRKSEAKKFEQKKAKRTTLEKDLNTNMELFQTRGVLDVCFMAPAEIPLVNTLVLSPTAIVNNLHSHVAHASTHTSQDNYMHQNVAHAATGQPRSQIRPSSIDIDWPIPIKWPKNDPRFHNPENADGQFDPDLLLHYALERTQLPVYENTFRWLCTQPMVQECVVFMFWLCKVKFFQKESRAEDEAFLVDGVSQQYVRIVELLAVKAHAEYEKDYIYTYLPYIIANAVSWAFHYLCPGSRHLYTKGFHKTILLQVIQIFHGIQLCPATVKANWLKLFPDDVQDSEADNTETFPLLIASTPSFSSTSATSTAGGKSLGVTAGEKVSFAGTAPPTGKPGVLADASMDAGGELASESRETIATGIATSSSLGLGGGTRRPPLGKSKSVGTSLKVGGKHSSLSGGFGGARLKINPRVHHHHGHSHSRSQELPGGEEDAGDAILPPLGASASQSMSLTLGETSPAYMRTNSLPGKGVLDRTTLSQALHRPRNVRVVQRQNTERMDAKSLSPVVQQFLKAPAPITGQASQPVSRSVPISWAVGGGADTHRRVPIPRELHDELSAKIAASARQNKHVSRKSHADQMQIVKHVTKECDIVLGSGSTTISRFSLDLIKRQRNARSGSAGANDKGGELDNELVDSGHVASAASFADNSSLLLDLEEELDVDSFLRGQGFLHEVKVVPDNV